MALDKLVDSTQLDTDLESIADTIREKGGTSEALSFPSGFVTAIEAIQTGGNLIAKTVDPKDYVQIITKDTELIRFEYKSPITSHSAGDGSIMSFNILQSQDDLIVDEEYVIFGKITVLDANQAELEYYDVNSTFVWSTTDRRTILKNDENAYYSKFTFSKNNLVQCRMGVTYQKTGTYGFKIEAYICEITPYNGLSSVTINPQKYTNDFMSSYIKRTITSIVWPDDLNSISSYAFAQCSSFNPPNLPNGITTIGPSAFESCESLALTELPDSIKNIQSSAFRRCSSLALTSLPNNSNLTKIFSYAFAGCRSLALSNLSNYITEISDHAFDTCDNITISSLPNNLTLLDSYAFYKCSKITISSIPSTITSHIVASNAFYQCEGITSMIIPSGFTTIDNYAFARCFNLANLSLPDTITRINAAAFTSCISLTSVECDGVITTLSSNAFTSDYSAYEMILRSVSFPNMALTSNMGTVFGSTTVGFACRSLEFIDIGKTTGIASNAFANCYSLETIVLRKTSVCSLANVSAFLNTPLRGYNNKTGTVYVPSALIANYKTATNWSTLYNAGTVSFEAIEGSDYELD